MSKTKQDSSSKKKMGGVRNLEGGDVKGKRRKGKRKWSASHLYVRERISGLKEKKTQQIQHRWCEGGYGTGKKNNGEILGTLKNKKKPYFPS